MPRNFHVFADCHLTAAKAAIAQDDFQTALSHLKTVLEADPDQFEHRLLKARILSGAPNPSLRDGRTALALAKDLVREYSHSAEASAIEAFAYSELVNCSAAVERIEQTIGLADGEDVCAQYQAFRDQFKRQQPFRLRTLRTAANLNAP